MQPYNHSHSQNPSPLAAQLTRLHSLTCGLQPSPQFWLGYISAYTNPYSVKTRLPNTLENWQALSQIIRIMGELVDSGVMRKENVFEIIVWAIYEQRQNGEKENERRRNGGQEQGIDLLGLIGTIEKYMNQVALNMDYFSEKLKNGGGGGGGISFSYSSNKNSNSNSINNKINPGIKIEEKPFINPQSSSNLMKVQQVRPSLQSQSQDINKKLQQKSESIGIGIECPICLAQVSLQTVCPVSCGHNLHKSCLIQHFKSRVESKKFPITCPEQNCSSEIVIQDLQEYIPKDLLEKYYEFSLHQFVDKNHKSTNWCPTAGCSAVFTIEGHLTLYKCPSCKKEYCLDCKTEAHPTMTCQTNKLSINVSQQDKQFIKFVQGEGTKMKQCPSCKFWVEKNKGCDHMTCRCTYQFCFRCGAKYGECSCDQADSYYGDDDDDDDGSIGDSNGDGSQPYRGGSEGGEMDDEEVEVEEEIQSLERIRIPMVPRMVPPPPPVGLPRFDRPDRIARIFFDRSIPHSSQRRGQDREQEESQSSKSLSNRK